MAQQQRGKHDPRQQGEDVLVRPAPAHVGRAIELLAKQQAGQQGQREQHEAGGDEAKHQALQRQQGHTAVLAGGAVAHLLFDARHQPAVRHRRGKQAIGRQPQCRVQAQQGRRSGRQGRPRKHQRQCDGRRAKARERPARTHARIALALDAVDREHQPHRDRQRLRKTEVRRLQQLHPNQLQAVQGPSQRQHAPRADIAQRPGRQRRHGVGQRRRHAEHPGKRGGTG